MCANAGTTECNICNPKKGHRGHRAHRAHRAHGCGAAVVFCALDPEQKQRHGPRPTSTHCEAIQGGLRSSLWQHYTTPRIPQCSKYMYTCIHYSAVSIGPAIGKCVCQIPPLWTTQSHRPCVMRTAVQIQSWMADNCNGNEKLSYWVREPLVYIYIYIGSRTWGWSLRLA